MADTPGRFILINDILCMTEESDGSFRPSDMFETADRSDVVAFLRSTRARLARSDAGMDESAARHGDISFSLRAGGAEPRSESNADSTPSLDDTAFNSFGTLSHGVLMDMGDGTFTDFATPDTLRPAALRGRDGAGRALDAVDDANVARYRAGDFAAVQPRAALLLCASLEPMADKAGSLPMAGAVDYLAWPRSGRLLSRTDVRRMSRHRQKQLEAIVALPRDSEGDTAASVNGSGSGGGGGGVDIDKGHWQRWYKAEVVRLTAKTLRPCETYLAPAPPARLQYRGATLRSGGVDDLTGNAGAEPAGAVPSAASFACYMGKPSMELATRKRDRSLGVAANTTWQVPVLARLRLRPSNEEARLSASAGAGDSRHFMHPPDSSRKSARARAWWVFTVYYPYIGVEAVQPSRPRRGESVAYRIGDNANFSAAACVRRKCAEADATVEARKQSGSGEGSSAVVLDRARKDRVIVSDAWNYLMLHQRDDLLERLWRVEAYLRKLERLQVP